MRVARVMSLYHRHTGQQAVTVRKTPEGLDVTASISTKCTFLHVVNTNRASHASVSAVELDMAQAFYD